MPRKTLQIVAQAVGVTADTSDTGKASVRCWPRSPFVVQIESGPGGLSRQFEHPSPVWQFRPTQTDGAQGVRIPKCLRLKKNELDLSALKLSITLLPDYTRLLPATATTLAEHWCFGGRNLLGVREKITRQAVRTSTMGGIASDYLIQCVGVGRLSRGDDGTRGKGSLP
ncbi:hypothetical protein R1flu_002065 [Riccia fluitans]|uniref:Uncharacterized protein n=1 Tax=Riccia fluitans TaxID=41844 RepID=A0ABD1Y5K0_9MARC